MLRHSRRRLSRALSRAAAARCASASASGGSRGLVEEAVLPGGSVVAFESGELARLADGAALVRHGDNAVLATVVSSAPSFEDAATSDGFLPLQVEYKEKAFASGRIPATFTRREGAPRDREVLACRVIDRALRPRFPKGFAYETQLLASLLSADGNRHADVAAINAAAAAVALSDVPFDAPVAAVRVGATAAGELVVDPDADTLRDECALELLYARAEGDRALMVEAAARPGVSEAVFAAALRLAHDAAAPLLDAQRRLMAAASRAKRTVKLMRPSPAVSDALLAAGGAEAVRAALFDPSVDKAARAARLEAAKARVASTAGMKDEEGIEMALEKLAASAVREGALEHGERVDGRALHELRPLRCMVGLLPGTHGDALFSRGDTQALTAVTVGGLADAAEQDHPVRSVPPKAFYVHYSMPPFATNEVGKVGGVGRREVGHGALAEKALAAVAPDERDFPFAVRVSSEVLGSNGSSSMATVCGGSLALMDAGVPVREHVAGISVGLVMDLEQLEASPNDTPRYALLTDIQGLEDGLGDMDFKICGTRSGITAVQLDIKPSGVPVGVLESALQPALEARHKILDAMEATISAPRESVGDNAPRVETIDLMADLVGKLVGLQGVGMRDIESRSGSKLTVEHSEDGERAKVSIFAPDAKSMALARALVGEAISGDVPVGKVLRARVLRLEEYGAILELFPSKRQGLLHVAEISHEGVGRAGDVLSVGQEIKVQVLDVDIRGNVKLSRKRLLPQSKAPAEAAKGFGPPPQTMSAASAAKSTTERGVGGKGGKGSGRQQRPRHGRMKRDS